MYVKINAKFFAKNTQNIAKNLRQNSTKSDNFRDGINTDDDYEYWLDGSLKKDKNKKIASITYNYLKLPEVITFDDNNTIMTEYDAEGTKLKEIVSGSEITDYEEDDIYVNGVLYQTSHDEGRIANGVYEYNIADHLGDLRVSFKDSWGLAVPTQSIFYDPFGNELRGLSFERKPATKNNFKFLGRESLPEIGLVDLQKRWYDPEIGCFISVDSMPDVGGQESQSPYQYSWNKPVLLSNPDGDYPCCGETAAAVGGFVTGLGEVVVRNVKALTVNLPETIQGFGSLGNPVGQMQAAIGDAMLYDKTKSDWNTGDTRTRANIVGNIVGEIGIAVAGSKGVGSLGKAGVVSDIAKVGEVAETVKVSSLGAGRAGVKQWLQGAGNLERGQLIQDIEGKGFKLTSPTKAPLQVFERGGMKIKLDPPQGKTLYNYMHLEYGGNSYNNLLSPVNFKSPAAHIPIK